MAETLRAGSDRAGPSKTVPACSPDQRAIGSKRKAIASKGAATVLQRTRPATNTEDYNYVLNKVLALIEGLWGAKDDVLDRIVGSQEVDIGPRRDTPATGCDEVATD
jgi:hypothetical protein